ncbi:MAG: hypothetical protein ACOX3T_02885 [Bdellovibrionota bacterium]
MAPLVSNCSSTISTRVLISFLSLRFFKIGAKAKKNKLLAPMIAQIVQMQTKYQEQK